MRVREPASYLLRHGRILQRTSNPRFEKATVAFSSKLKRRTRVLMVKNRDSLSIVAAILEAARYGASKTRIMSSANLSFRLLEKYLDSSVTAGFVRSENSRYILTEQGWTFLKRYQSFMERYSRVQKALEALSSEREQLAAQFRKLGLV